MTIKTPTLLLDEALCRKNIREMAEKTAAMGLTFRPHFKTHQSHKIGRWFREYGVDKICVSSVRMAEYFCEDGWEDILIAFPYNPMEVNEIRDLAGKTNLGLCITGPQSAELLARDCNFKVSVMIKTDTGYGRSGSLWDNSAGLRETYRILKQCKYISIKGLMTHSGNTYKAKSREEIQEISELSAERLIYARDSIGDPSLLLSVGDTPSASVCNEFKGIDELRPGNFVFYDLMQYFIGSCRLDQVAVRVACPVADISSDRSRVVIYGGGIHFSKEYAETEGRKVYGLLIEKNGDGWTLPSEPVYLESLSQEHGILRYSDRVPESISIGDLVYIIPVHSCLTAEALGGYLLGDGTMADHMQIKYRDTL